MKSLGAARKSGSSPIVDVIDYPNVVRNRSGVTLLCSPGNDVEATTALAAAGCNVTVFTTGLGTPTGNPICPMVKMSTNTELAERMRDIIDFDPGAIIRGERTIEQTGAIFSTTSSKLPAAASPPLPSVSARTNSCRGNAVCLSDRLYWRITPVPPATIATHRRPG
jgi:hypothetical protein